MVREPPATEGTLPFRLRSAPGVLESSVRYIKLLVFLAVIAAGYLFREPVFAYLHTLTGLQIFQTAAVPAKGPASPAPQAKSGRGPAVPAPVIVTQVVEKPMPVEFRSVATVQTESSVVVKVRVESMVERVLVADGSLVKEGDVLVELDKRVVEAQMEQARAAIQRDEAQIAQARRNDDRINELASRGVSSRVLADDARTAASVAMANRQADTALLRNLELQREFHTIRAPITGRVGVINVRPGSFVRNADANSIIATINQIDPVYVAMAVPQDLLAQISQAKASGTARLVLTAPGTASVVSGPVFMIDNTVDVATGLLTVRAKIPNPDSLVWPGQVVEASLVIREEPKAIVVPNQAVQTSQNGNYVFVVDAEKKARVRAVKLARTVGKEAVIASGLTPGETVVIDGHVRVTNGGAVSIAAPAKTAATKAESDTE